MQLHKFLCWTTCCTYIWLLSIGFVNSLRDVRVKVPHAVRRGEKATLKCLYDLEGDNLYSVKWYKGRREFYSFTPKETPAMKVFQFAGVRVERSASNESQLVLDAVNLATTGKYSCEVSADAPSFHTLIAAGELEVVEVPGKDPVITGIRPRYRVGDIVRGNCTSRHSKPAANLTWTINGYDTNPSHIRHHKPLRDARELETAMSGIHFVVTPQHFNGGKLKLRCTAYIHDVYWKSTEKSIEEERQRHNINTINTFSEDYFDLDDGNVMDRSDTYTTHIKGAVSSLNANGAARQHCRFLTTLTRLATLALAAYYALQQMLQLWQQLFGKQQQMHSRRGMTTRTSTPTAAPTATATAKGQQLSGTSVAVKNATATAITTAPAIGGTKEAAAKTITSAEWQTMEIARRWRWTRTRNENANVNANPPLIDKINGQQPAQQQQRRWQRKQKQPALKLQLQQQHLAASITSAAAAAPLLQTMKVAIKTLTTTSTVRVTAAVKTATTTTT